MGGRFRNSRSRGPVGGAFPFDVPASYRKSEAIAGHPFDVDSLIATAELHRRHTGRQSAPNTPQGQTSQLPCVNAAAPAVCGNPLIPLTHGSEPEWVVTTHCSRPTPAS